MGKKLYDFVNDETIVTSTKPGDGLVGGLTEEPIKAKPLRGAPAGASRYPGGDETFDANFSQTQRQRTTDQEDVSKYDEGASLDEDLNTRRANRQSTSAKFATSFFGGALDGVGTAIETIGYIFDVTDHVNRLTGGTLESNWFSDIGTNLKHATQKNIPTYETPIDEDAGFVESFFRWGTLRSAMDSMVGYGASGALVGAGTRMLGGALLNASRTASIAAKSHPGMAKFISNAAPAIMTNAGEGKTMALEVYEEQMKEYAPMIEAGTLTEEQAIKQASDAADNFQAWNTLFVATDYIGFKNLFHGSFKNVLKPSFKETGKKLLNQGVAEYFEETGQKVFQGNVSEAKFRDTEEEFGLWGGNKFIHENSKEKNSSLYEEQFNQYYSTKEGKTVANNLAKEYKNQDDYFNALDEHFVEAASSERMMNAKADGLIQRSLDIFTEPQTQVEGVIGFFSSMGQWAITRGAGYKKEHKKAIEHYEMQQDAIKEGAEFVKTKMKDTQTLNELNAELFKSTLNQDTKPIDEQDDSESVEDKPTDAEKVIAANNHHAWLSVMNSAHSTGTQDQLRRLLTEQKNGPDNEASERATKLLDEFNNMESIIKDSQRYYNSDQVVGAQIKLNSLLTFRDAVKDSKNVSAAKKNHIEDLITMTKDELKDLTSFETQKELVTEQYKIEKVIKRANRAIKKNDIQTMDEMIADKTIPLNIRLKLDRYKKGKKDNLNTKPNTKKKAPKNPNPVPEAPPVETEFEKKRRIEEETKLAVAQKRSAAPLKNVDKKITNLTKIIAKREKIISNAEGKKLSPAKELEISKVKQSLSEDKAKLERLGNSRKAILDVSYELSDLSDEEYAEKFDDALEERLKGSTTPQGKTFIPKTTAKQNEEMSGKLDSKNRGEITNAVMENHNNKSITEFNIDLVPVDVVFNATPTTKRLTDIYKKTVNGKDIYVVDREGEFTADQFANGRLSVYRTGIDGDGKHNDYQIMYTFELANGATMSIGNHALVDGIAQTLYEAVLKDNENKENDKTSHEQDADFNKFVSESDKAAMKIGLNDYETLSMNPISNTYAYALMKNRSYINEANPHYGSLVTLMEMPSLLERSVVALQNIDNTGSPSIKQARVQYVKNLKDNYIKANAIYRDGNHRVWLPQELPVLLKEVDAVMAKEAEAQNKDREKKKKESKTPPNTPKTAKQKEAEMVSATNKALEFLESTKRKEPLAAMARMMERISSNYEGKIDSITELVEYIVNMDGISDKALGALENKFVKFTQAVAKIQPEIVIDAATYEKATNSQKPTENNFENETVTIDAATVLDNELDAALHHLQLNDKTVIKDRTDLGFETDHARVKSAYDKIAYLAKAYTKNFRYDELTNKIEVSYEDLKDSFIWSEVMSRNTAVNDNITLEIDTEYDDVISYNNELIQYSEFLNIAKDDQELRDSYIPVKIMKGDLLLGYLHQPDWMHEQHLDGNAQENIDKVREIRRRLITSGKPISTKITKKGLGKLMKLDTQVATSDVFMDDVELYIADRTNTLRRGYGNSEKAYKSETNKQPGIVYAKVPLTATESIYVPLTNNELTQQQKDTINEAIRIYKDKDRTAELWLAVKNGKGKVDIASAKGVKNFLKKYVRLYEAPTEADKSATGKANTLANKKMQKTEFVERSTPFFAIMDDTTIESAQLDNPTIKVRMQVDTKMLGTSNFDAFEVVKNQDGSYKVVNVNEGKGYDHFVKQNTKSFYGSYTHTREDGSSETVYSYQNVTNFDTTFLNESTKKGKETTKSTGTKSTRSSDTTQTPEEVREVEGEKELIDKITSRKVALNKAKDKANKLTKKIEKDTSDIKESEVILKDLEIDKKAQAKKTKAEEIKKAKKTVDKFTESPKKAVEEEVTKADVQDVAKEEGITETQAKKKIITATTDELEGKTTNIKPKSALRRIIDRIKKAIMVAFAMSTIYGGTTAYAPADGSYNFNNVIETSLEVLPDYMGESAVRYLAKQGVYDVTKHEAQVDTSSIQEAPKVDITAIENAKYKNDNTYTQEIGKVKDSHYKARKGASDSLFMVRNQFFNDEGFTYVSAPVKSRTTGNEKITGVKGIAHFMVLDDTGVDLTTKTSDKELKEASKQFREHRIGNDIAMTDYVPVFKRNGNKVTTSYKLASEIDSNDVTITRLHQFKVSDIDFNSKESMKKYGFKGGGVYGLKNIKTGKPVPNFLFTDAGKDSYSRFSGASVVFIFNDTKGNTIVRDLTGSINMIKNEAAQISKDFGVPSNDITIGVYDAGSYTAKPAAKNGVLETDQYKGYNILHPNSAGALVIPSSKSDSAPTKKAASALLALALGLKRRFDNKESISDDEINDLKLSIKSMKESLKASKTNLNNINVEIKNIETEINSLESAIIKRKETVKPIGSTSTRSSNTTQTSKEVWDVEGKKEELNKWKRKDIEVLFKNNPLLSEIGSIEEYNNYLKSIFPNSKVDYFLYHGTNSNFETFNKSTQNKNTDANFISEGFWFARTKEDAESFGKNIKTVILNQQNPYEKSAGINEKGYYEYADQVDDIKLAKKAGNDSAILDINEGGLDGDSPVTEHVVFEPNQIHELGSDKDVKGFRKFKLDILEKRIPEVSFTTKTEEGSYIDNQEDSLDNLLDELDEFDNKRSEDVGVADIQDPSTDMLIGKELMKKCK